MALTILEDEATEQGVFGFSVTFTDDDGDAVIPNADTIFWTLTNNVGTVINDRDNEAEASAASITIVLSGDDLAILPGETAPVVRRRITVLWEYDSDLGDDLPGTAEVILKVRNLTRLPATE